MIIYFINNHMSIETMENILVSIITVCYNSESTIEKTIKSVLNQTYSNIEYIIVDGKSTDGTMEIVEKYYPEFNGRMKVISEPDKGIYDAMNKGIGKASGLLIGIINSDDYYENDAVENIISAMTSDSYQIIYGMLRMLNDGVETMVMMPKHENLKNAMIAHPTCFVTKSVYQDCGMFDLQYKSCSDYDFMLRMSENKEIVFVPVYKIIASFSDGVGISAQETSRLETLKMLRNHGYIDRKTYCVGLLKSYIKRCLKQLR